MKVWSEQFPLKVGVSHYGVLSSRSPLCQRHFTHLLKLIIIHQCADEGNVERKSLCAGLLQAEEQKNRERVEREKDEEVTRFEMQQSVLSENLTTVRGDLTATTQKVEDLTRVNEELKGEKLGQCEIGVISD